MRGILMLIALLIVLVCAGCPVPDPSPDAGVTAYLGEIAANLSLASLVSTGQAPDQPLPAGTCPQCRGTGKVGDGVIAVPCQACGGDGRIEAPATGVPIDEWVDEEPPLPEEAPQGEAPTQAPPSSGESSATGPQPDLMSGPVNRPRVVSRPPQQSCQGAGCTYPAPKKRSLLGIFPRK